MVVAWLVSASYIYLCRVHVSYDIYGKSRCNDLNPSASVARLQNNKNKYYDMGKSTTSDSSPHQGLSPLNGPSARAYPPKSSLACPRYQTLS